MKYARIIGTGSYLPEKILTNYDLAKLVDTSDEWIVERSGIKQRYIAADHETVSSMAEMASRQALEAAGISAQDIDLIVVATSTAENVFPSSACLLQKRLGITKECPAFDINAACAGFSYALNIADSFIRSGNGKTALIVGSEVMSRILDWQDRSTCILFGDGAGAMILQADNEPGILSTHIFADGKYHDLLCTPRPEVSARDQIIKPYLMMAGREVFKIAVAKLGELVEQTLTANNMQKSQIDWLIPHQANLRIINAIAKKLAMPIEQVVITVDKHSNTSSASIPLALDVAIRDGRIKRKQTLLLEAFGAGFAWGSALIIY